MSEKNKRFKYFKVGFTQRAIDYMRDVIGISKEIANDVTIVDMFIEEAISKNSPLVTIISTHDLNNECECPDCNPKKGNL